MGKQNYSDPENPLPLRIIVCTKPPFKNHLEMSISSLEKPQKEKWVIRTHQFYVFQQICNSLCKAALHKS